MSFYPHRNPRWITNLISSVRPGYTWYGPETTNTLYLTFDDGPIPEATPWILDLLKQYNAKATFFCLGKNIDANPSLLHSTIADGHTVGNHTYNHPNGRIMGYNKYINEILKCQQALANQQVPYRALFRPPYGRLRPKHRYWLMKNGYDIILWEVLSGDFDESLSPEKCASNTIGALRPGSIVVFHDSIKALPRLKVALPAVLEFAKKQGWELKAL